MTTYFIALICTVINFFFKVLYLFKLFLIYFIHRLYLPSWIKHFVNCVKPRNKSLHQRHFSLKGNIKQTPSRLLVLTLGSGCVGVVTFIRTFSNHAHCEYKPKNRLSAYEETGKIPEPKLPWKEFFKLLLPDIWYLIGAILVCIHEWCQS